MLRRGTKSLHCNLVRTDYTNSMRPILVIVKQRVGQANSVGPIRSSRWDRNVTKRKQSVCIAILVGPIAHLGWTETLRRETEILQSHLGETEIPIGKIEVTRVLWQWLCQLNSVAPDWKNRWGRVGYLVWDICGYEKVMEGLEHITKHLEQEPH